MLKDTKTNGVELHEEENNNIFDKIKYVTKVISPILLPMIAGLGELEESSPEEEFEGLQD
jgi:hypothetical protein